MTRRVLFISKGDRAASTRYRALAFFPGLRDAGWEPLHLSTQGGPLAKLGLLRAARRADAVVVLRRLFSAPMRTLLRKSAKHLVFDFDDAIFTSPDGRDSTSRRKGFDDIVRQCDQVWAGNEYLAEAARALNPRVTCLPTVLDPVKYQVSPVMPADRIDLVWIGSSSTRRYLESAIPMLDEAAKRDDRLRLKIVADFDLHSNAIPTIPRPWSDTNEATELASSHIGIAPMPDDEWTRGKCAFKVIQYMAAGLPVISSDAGANRDVVRYSVTGMLASTDNQWLEAIKTLADDADLRSRMGHAGRRRAIEHYSIAAGTKQIMALLPG